MSRSGEKRIDVVVVVVVRKRGTEGSRMRRSWARVLNGREREREKRKMRERV